MYRNVVFLPTCLLLSLFCIASGRARAASMDMVSYELGIATDINLLRDPSDPLNQKAATWKTSAEIAVSRKSPVLRLSNTSGSSNITGFSLDVNDPMFVFDALTIAEAPVGFDAVLQSPTDVLQNGDTSSRLSFSFESQPLGPNESFAFWLDIDPVDHSSRQPVDYRNVLWNRFGTTRSDNALVGVTFDTLELKEVPLFEYSMANATMNTLFEDGTSGRSFVYPLMHNSDSIGAFFFSQTGRIETSPAPEPSAVLLMGIGVLVLAICRLRMSSNQ